MLYPCKFCASCYFDSLYIYSFDIFIVFLTSSYSYPFSTGVHRSSLDDCEKLYRRLSTQIFTQTTFRGATGLFMKNSYYDSDAWTEILKENMGEMSLIETARNLDTPKVWEFETSYFVFCDMYRI